MKSSYVVIISSLIEASIKKQRANIDLKLDEENTRSQHISSDQQTPFTTIYN